MIRYSSKCIVIFFFMYFLLYIISVSEFEKKGLSTALIDLIMKILKKDPKDRLTLEKIKQHKWMEMGKAQHQLSSRSGPKNSKL